MVSLVYREGDRLSPIPGSDVGLLIVQFAAGPDSVWLQKELSAGSTNIEIVRVNGVDALWIEGAHQLTVLADTPESSAVRSSANVLIWNLNGITCRIETALSQSTTIEIAESMQPIVP